jgi:hypothetical protein
MENIAPQVSLRSLLQHHDAADLRRITGTLERFTPAVRHRISIFVYRDVIEVGVPQIAVLVDIVHVDIVAARGVLLPISIGYVAHIPILVEAVLHQEVGKPVSRLPVAGRDSLFMMAECLRQDVIHILPGGIDLDDEVLEIVILHSCL